MKTEKLWHRAAAVLLSVLLCVFGMGTAAFAEEGLDPARDASLRVYFGEADTPFSGASFAIYRVADISQDGAYTLSGDFQSYPVALENLDSSGWRALAQTLSAYAARDDLQPLARAQTGADGWADFPDLSTGLYLVTGEAHVSGGVTYTPEPMLLSLPTVSDGAWVYDVEASCKFDSTPAPSETVTRKVLKIWKDTGNEADRPEEITVQLLKDGAVVDTVRLNEENSWSYTWQNLDAAAAWQVAELDTPSGYTVSVSQEGITFVMTNTRDSTTPSTPTASKPPMTTTGGRIPQTGALWWPVPLLLCGGLALLCVGCFLRRREKGPHAH